MHVPSPRVYWHGEERSHVTAFIPAHWNRWRRVAVLFPPREQQRGPRCIVDVGVRESHGTEWERPSLEIAGGFRVAHSVSRYTSPCAPDRSGLLAEP